MINIVPKNSNIWRACEG